MFARTGPRGCPDPAFFQAAGLHPIPRRRSLESSPRGFKGSASFEGDGVAIKIERNGTDTQGGRPEDAIEAS